MVLSSHLPVYKCLENITQLCASLPWPSQPGVAYHRRQDPTWISRPISNWGLGITPGSYELRKGSLKEPGIPAICKVPSGAFWINHLHSPYHNPMLSPSPGSWVSKEAICVLVSGCWVQGSVHIPALPSLPAGQPQPFRTPIPHTGL